MPISYLPFEQRKCGWVPRGPVYSVPPFIIFNAKHTGAGFPFTGNSGLKYRHVPHIFSGRRLSGAHPVGILGISDEHLFYIVSPSFQFILSPAFIPWVAPWHFDPVYFNRCSGEHFAQKFRHCFHFFWHVERFRFLIFPFTFRLIFHLDGGANVDNRATLTSVHELCFLFTFANRFMFPGVIRRSKFVEIVPVCACTCEHFHCQPQCGLK